jgi:hypothetical protein
LLETEGRERKMFVATAVLSGLLALVFATGAVGKVAKMRPELDKAVRLRIPRSRYRLIALPEAAAVVGLVVGLSFAPLGVAAAIGLVALMVGAVAFRVRVSDPTPLIAGDAAVMVMAGVAAALRVVSA